ncbi:hypothetical protein ABD91_26090 [Lysinibacillus sphaericus]|uniref:hypothetical protein n=1 Tax=Lysinibacillus sphaericus TaxID=1421 RepID=UPI0018CF193A|nr:hypothetical protein [Lysinibacillus sphaericus]MBG9694204.1 hypothetical protein [Lysinibacillus sphaericus]
MLRSTQIEIDQVKAKIHGSESNFVDGQVIMNVSMTDINQLLDLAYRYERESFGTSEVLQKANELLEAPQYDPIEAAKALIEAGFAGWTLVNNTYQVSLIRDLMNPIEGDYVFETTNPFVEPIKAVGKLIEIVETDCGKVFRILRLDGVVQEWLNAHFAKVVDAKTRKLVKEA